MVLAYQTMATSKVDYAGPFQTRIYLMITDAHSKWPEITEMSSTTASRKVDELCKLFSSYGLPEQTVTGSGPQFVPEEFAAFIKMNGMYKTH